VNTLNDDHCGIGAQSQQKFSLKSRSLFIQRRIAKADNEDSMTVLMRKGSIRFHAISSRSPNEVFPGTAHNAQITTYLLSNCLDRESLTCKLLPLVEQRY